MKVCHLTSLHSPNDIRIFIKECSTLGRSNIDTHYVVPSEVSYTKDNVVIHSVKKEDTNRLKRMVSTTKLVYEKALEINADVYHFHDPELIPIALQLKSKEKKVVYDVHEDMPRSILSKYWIPKPFRKIIAYSFEKYENSKSKRFDYIIGATPYIANRFSKINPNTIDINNYPLLKELANKEPSLKKEKQVCYVGGITPIRGISNIVKVSNLVKGDIIMAGNISGEELEKEIKTSKVKYKGLLNREEVNSLLNKSVAGLVLFLPEPNHINAQPNKMFEYMSAGIPVIASNFPLWREIIEGNKCGICVDPEDPKEIANAIQWIFDNPEEAVNMGKNGRKAVEEKYNWEAESVKLINLYKVLERKINNDKES
ncbi:glycosyltransferase family 4 protein [Virgibacillus halodenitrificans]|uniref:glycosyltransferase family 4 protein n=1 Tax=Virgibacillus halodenitrificans TaxID=1482 RepID=UPI0024BF62B0|nr:glycosyltransferase family 4 protein [Virgibacillus halodenitrificans]WHX26171.1 glycosyltransferase family 4 protein [Virgibacillus halodenitrificans]